MKQLTTLLFVLLAGAGGTNAQSLLRVHLADNSRINISVNSRYFNKRGTTVTVGDLPGARHYLKIFGVTYDRWGRVYDRLIYQGTVSTYDGMITNFIYDPYTRRVTMRTNPIDDSRNGYAQNQPTDRYNGNRDIVPDLSTPPAQPPAPEDDTKVSPQQGGTPAASPVGTSTLTDQASDKIKTKVDAKGTDTEKMKYLKEALRNETLTTFQVSYMMDWFLFESTKLEFARWAYNITTDKEYYDDLAAKFNYNSSKEELQQFLESTKGGR